MISATLNYIELPATDLAATKAFYEATFGWTFTVYGPAYASADASGNEVAFNAEATVGTMQASGDQNSTGPLLLLQIDDIDAVHSELSTIPDAIVTSPYDYPGGRRLHFRDPSGNVLGLYQPHGA